jgi:hypothetical protein
MTTQQHDMGTNWMVRLVQAEQAKIQSIFFTKYWPCNHHTGGTCQQRVELQP